MKEEHNVNRTRETEETILQLWDRYRYSPETGEILSKKTNQ